MAKTITVSSIEQITKFLFHEIDQDRLARDWSDTVISNHLRINFNHTWKHQMRTKELRSASLVKIVSCVDATIKVEMDGKILLKTFDWQDVEEFARDQIKRYRLAHGYGKKSMRTVIGNSYPEFENGFNSSPSIVINGLHMCGMIIELTYNGLDVPNNRKQVIKQEVFPLTEEQQRELVADAIRAQYVRDVRPGNGKVVNGFTGW